jgi:hypothetical protein
MSVRVGAGLKFEEFFAEGGEIDGEAAGGGRAFGD